MSKRAEFDASAMQVKYVTKDGVASWASLKTPHTFEGDDKSNYLITTIHPAEEVQDLVDLGNGLIEKCVDMMGKRPKMSPHDFHKTMEDGRVRLKWKRPFFKENDRMMATPPIKTYMPDGTAVDWEKTDWHVGNDSIVRIGGFLRPYYNTALGLGISLRLDAVKIMTLIKYVPGQASNFDEFATDVSVAGSSTSAETVTEADF